MVSVPAAVLLLALSAASLAWAQDDTLIEVQDFTQLSNAADTINTAWSNPSNQDNYMIVITATTIDMRGSIVFNFNQSESAMRELTIVGAGMDATTLDCGGKVDIAFEFVSAVDLLISGIHFTGCMGTSISLSVLGKDIAAIIPSAAALIDSCLFTNNQAFVCRAGAAGAIASNGLFSAITIANCVFDWNKCSPLDFISVFYYYNDRDPCTTYDFHYGGGCGDYGSQPPDASSDFLPPGAFSDYPPPGATSDYPPPGAISDYPPPAAFSDFQPPVISSDLSPPLAYYDYPPDDLLAVGYFSDCGCASSVAIYTASSVSVVNCTFKNGQQDGAFYMTAAALNIANITQQVEVSDCTFLNNTCSVECTGAPGAVFLADSTGTIEVSNSTFTGNYRGSAANYLNVKDTNGAGALLLNQVQAVSVYNCTFVNNTLMDPHQSSGALTVWEATVLTVDLCTFTGNQVVLEGELISDTNSAAALLVIRTPDISLTHSSFVSNVVLGNASRSSGGANLGFVEMALIDNCIFQGNNGGLVGLGALMVQPTHRETLPDDLTAPPDDLNPPPPDDLTPPPDDLTPPPSDDLTALPDSLNPPPPPRDFNPSSRRALGNVSAQRITISNTLFIGNQADVNQSVAGLYVNVADVLAEDGTASDAVNSNLEAHLSVTNCTFQDNLSKGRRGIGAMYAMNLASVTVESCKFVNNIATGRDRELSNAEVFDDLAFTGSIGSVGGLQLANIISSVVLKDSQFSDNSGPGFDGTGAIFLFDIHAPVNIGKCTFNNNSALNSGAGGCIAMTSVSNLLIHEALFEDNVAGCNASLWLDIATPRSCGGGAVRIGEQSFVTVLNSTFKGNKAINGRSFGGAIMLNFDANLLAIANNFTNNTAAAGGAIFALGGSVVRIDMPVHQNGCLCTRQIPSVDPLQEAFPRLFDQYFDIEAETPILGGSIFSGNTAFSGGALAVANSEVTVGYAKEIVCTCNHTTTLFDSNSAYTGGAISSVRNIAGSYIVNSILTNNVACNPNEEAGCTPAALKSSQDFSTDVVGYIGCGIGMGGALCFTCAERCLAALANTSVDGNSATYGAGMYTSADVLQCAIPDNCYTSYVTGLNHYDYGFTLHNVGEGNVFVTGTQTNFTNNVAVGGAGGAIYMEHLETVDVLCINGKDTAMVNQSFNGNKTAMDNVFQYLPCTEWTGNQVVDGGFGPEVASSPVSFTAPLILQPYQWLLNNNTVYYTSGDPLAFNVSVWDIFNQEHVTSVVNPRARVLLTMTVSETRVGDTVLQLEAAAMPGRLPVNRTTLTVRAAYGSRVVNLTAESISLLRTLTGSETELTVRPCKIGEYNRDGFECLPCDVNFFNTEPNVMKDSCNVCPDNAICVTDTSTQPSANNSVIVPTNDNFNSNPYSQQLYECAWNGRACDHEGREERLMEYQATLVYDPTLYNRTTYSEIMCDPGFTGVLCGTCRMGYGTTFTGCNKCLDQKWAAQLVFAVITIIFTCPIFFLLRAASTTTAAALNAGEDQATGGPSGWQYQEEENASKGDFTPRGVHTRTNSRIVVEGSMRSVERGADPVYHSPRGVLSRFGPDAGGRFPEEGQANYSKPPSITSDTPDQETLPHGIELTPKNPRSRLQGWDADSVADKPSLNKAGPVAEGDEKPPLAPGPLKPVLVHALPEHTRSPPTSDSAGSLPPSNATHMHHFTRVASAAQVDPPSRMDSMPPSDADGSETSNTDRGPKRAPLHSFMGRLQYSHRIGQTTAAQEESHFIMLSATIKVFISYIQILFMLDWIERSNPVLPSVFVTIMALAQAVFSTSYSFISLECAIGEWGQLNKQIAISIFTIAYPFIVYACIVMFVIVRHLSWHTWCWWQQRKFNKVEVYQSKEGSPTKDSQATLATEMEADEDDRRATVTVTAEMEDEEAELYSVTALRTKIIVAATITVFYFYQNWTQAILLMFICYRINMDGPDDDTALAIEAGLNPGLRWYQNFDLVCFEGQHGYLAWILGIPGIVGIVLIPVATAWFLAANCHQLDDPRFRSRYGFIYDEYKPHFYAWEAVIMFRKLALAACIMFLSSSNYPVGAQVLSTMAIAVVGLIVHVMWRPYSSSYVHNLELMGQLTICITLFLSLYFIAPSFIPEAYVIISIALSAINIIVGFIFLVCMLLQTLDGLLLMAGLDPKDVHELSHAELKILMLHKFPGVFRILAGPAAYLAVILHILTRNVQLWWRYFSGTATGGLDKIFTRVVKRNNSLDKSYASRQTDH